MVADLPVPTLDHVVVNVRDRIDAGLETWRRLGFTMTPRGYHTLGSMNHLAILGSEYLELIAAAPGATRRPEILAAPFGLNGLVFGTENSAGVYAALREAGVPVEPPLEFSRPVELAEGSRDATFRTVHITPGTVPAGRVYFCHHLTRDLVWRDEWRHHANGAIGIERAVIAAREPEVLGALFARMFGEDAVRRDRHWLLARVGAVAVRRDHAGRAVPRVRRCGACGGWTRAVHGCAHRPHPFAGIGCGRAGGRADQRRPAGSRSHHRARYRDPWRNPRIEGAGYNCLIFSAHRSRIGST